MNRTFTAARGLPLLAKDTAEQIGTVKHFVVEHGKVAALHVEGGKKDGRLVAWTDIASFGDDAVVVENSDVLKDPTTDRERRALRGDLVMVGKLVLDDIGDRIGEVSDVAFDPTRGTIDTLTAGGEDITGTRLRGVGSYAVVVTAPDDA